MSDEHQQPESDTAHDTVKIPANTNDTSDARFIGWQETNTGDVFALYNITAADHPLRGSTVTDHGLRDMNLKVPETPVPDKPVRII